MWWWGGGGGGGGGATFFFNITEGGLELFLFLVWRGLLSKFLLDNSSFSAPPPPPPPDNYCTVPKLQISPSKRAFEKYKPRGLCSEFYSISMPSSKREIRLAFGNENWRHQLDFDVSE